MSESTHALSASTNGPSRRMLIGAVVVPALLVAGLVVTAIYAVPIEGRFIWAPLLLGALGARVVASIALTIWRHAGDRNGHQSRGLLIRHGED